MYVHAYGHTQGVGEARVLLPRARALGSTPQGRPRPSPMGASGALFSTDLSSSNARQASALERIVQVVKRFFVWFQSSLKLCTMLLF